MNDFWYDSFIESLFRKYPKKAKLAEALMDLLSIERESAYRRIRRDIIFPAHELVKIASAWDISLDEIVGINSRHVIFKVHLWNYLKPSEDELNDMRALVRGFETIDNHYPDMEYMEISNRLPRMLTSGFPYLHRFHLLKWMYQYINEDVMPFSRIFYPEQVSELSSAYYLATKNVSTTNFIWNLMLFNYLVDDVRYFHSIFLITDEEKELIKKDLYALLDYMLEVAVKGCWPETGKKVNLYISYIYIDTNYGYYYSEGLKVCFVHAFGKNEIITSNLIMVENFKSWMQSKKRASVQISEADEKSRIEFFMKQRGVIDTL
ncbi:MAG: hypothetical protein FWF54_10430 [Candidatus Azobacteroides sp.]|jgi:hypothetical protein|nr:hypothetical protein [Candidatus Azobacteroides sp.]